MNMESALSLIHQIAVKHVRAYFIGNNPEAATALVTYINTVKYGTHFYAFASDADFLKQWDIVRRSQYVLDFVMAVTMEFRSRYSASEDVYGVDDNRRQWDNLCDLVGMAVGGLRAGKELLAGSFMDEDFLERGLDVEHWTAAFKANAWLLTLVLLQMAPELPLSPLTDEERSQILKNAKTPATSSAQPTR